MKGDARSSSPSSPSSRLDIYFSPLSSPLSSRIPSRSLVHSPLLSFLARLFSRLLLVLACVQGVGAAEGGERGRGLARHASTDREGAPVWRRAACGCEDNCAGAGAGADVERPWRQQGKGRRAGGRERAESRGRRKEAGSGKRAEGGGRGQGAGREQRAKGGGREQAQLARARGGARARARGNTADGSARLRLRLLSGAAAAEQQHG